MINTAHYKIFKIAVACLSSCFFMAACENDVDAVKALGARVSGIDVGKDVAIFVSNDGKLGAKLTAPLMNRYLEDSSKMIEFPKSIHVDFYKDSNQIESQLSAKYAKYKELENIVYLKEDIVIFNTLGDTLWCKEM
jgi:lipopolysaccharide export system protein LptC